MAAGVLGSRSLLTDIQAEIGSTIDIDGYWSLKGIMLLAINDEKIKGTALKYYHVTLSIAIYHFAEELLYNLTWIRAFHMGRIEITSLIFHLKVS